MIPEIQTMSTADAVQEQLVDAQCRQRSGPLHLLDLPPDAGDAWPKPMEQEAFHGPAGDFVADVLPETEADEAALLFHFLTIAAAMMGRARYFAVSGTRHHARLFSVCVGGTASGRKGTALDCAMHVFRLVDGAAGPGGQSFCQENTVSGLVSGSGLIWQLRDERGTGKDHDPGVVDKRLLVIESELGGVLRVCQRRENDLSAVIRDCWDGKTLRTLAKQQPATATDPHVNIIGHVTREELRTTLSSVDTSNGFANRILWYGAKRSKLLPDGGKLHSRNFSSLVMRVRSAIDRAQTPGRMLRTKAADSRWHQVYPELTSPRAGVFGNVTTRAEAQVLRLSMLYALLDESDSIDVEHLEAALAVWRYSEDSARWAFGSSLGNATADELLAALRHVKPQGMSATDIHALFSKNRRGTDLREALGLLERLGMARFVKSAAKGRGRPAVVWFAT
jgi:hypothetical protein